MRARVRAAIAYAARPAVAGRSAVLALVVGTILSAVNQGEALRGPPSSSLRLILIANYLIPFLVSSASAAANAPRGRCRP